MRSRNGGRAPVHSSLRGQLNRSWNMSRGTPWRKQKVQDKESKEESRYSDGEVKGTVEHGK